MKKIEINKDICLGCGACCGIDEEHFEFGEDGFPEAKTNENLEKLRDTCSNVKDLAILEILISTGMRVGKITRINISDMNFQEISCIVLGVSIIKSYNRLGISGIEISIRNLGKEANINKVHPHKL